MCNADSFKSNHPRMKENMIAEMTFDFFLKVIELYRPLVEQKEFVLYKQLLRSAAGIGANVEEANAAQTKKDFISKMSIASKEARETRYWLRLLDKSQMATFDYELHLETIDKIIRILTKL